MLNNTWIYFIVVFINYYSTEYLFIFIQQSSYLFIIIQQ